jgi:hypothetical protein
MPRPARRTAADDRADESAFDAAFAEVTGGRTSEVAARQRVRSEVVELTVPPDERPSRDNLPGSIEEAVLAALEQVPRSATVPPPSPGHAVDASDDDAPGGTRRERAAR